MPASRASLATVPLAEPNVAAASVAPRGPDAMTVSVWTSVLGDGRRFLPRRAELLVCVRLDGGRLCALAEDRPQSRCQRVALRCRRGPQQIGNDLLGL